MPSASYVTGQSRLPWSGVALLNFVWFGELYVSMLHGVGATFVARNLTADPRLVVLVSTSGLLFSGTVGPLINYASDRVWTRWGRRRPFLVPAYFLSAAGLAIIPFADTLTALFVAVAAQACAHAFASPLESLCMELVPPSQLGRSQAIRNTVVQSGVLFFMQLVLVQFAAIYPLPGGSVATITGVHLAFWLGASLLVVMAIFFAVCTRESTPTPGPGPRSTSPRWLSLVRAFPRAVFADRSLWPAYGLYIVPGLATAAWGSLQPLMLVDQFGYSVAEMAQIGLPSTLAGLAVVGPLLGYFADGSATLGRGQCALGAAGFALAAGWIWEYLPDDPAATPTFAIALLYTVVLALSVACLLLLVVQALAPRPIVFSLRARLVVAAIAGKSLVAAGVWGWVMHSAHGVTVMPRAVWLTYCAVSQIFSLATMVTVIPLIFSCIPSSKFGTAGSAFGVSNAVISYAVGNLGGAWIYFRRAEGTGRVNYSDLWLLQAIMGAGALWLAWHCLRRLAPAALPGPPAQSPSS